MAGPKREGMPFSGMIKLKILWNLILLKVYGIKSLISIILFFFHFRISSFFLNT